MFSWRARRQLAVFALIAAVAGGIAFWVALKFVPSSTCSDNRKNQGELGIDCGGPCGPCELKKPRNVSIFWARFGHAAPGVFDAVALVENPNETLSSGAVQYEFAFFDDIGEIGRRVGTTFIFPQERIYVVEPNIQLVREPTRVEFKILAAPAWQLTSGELPTLVVQDRKYQIRDIGGHNQSVAEATIANASPLDFRRMETAIVVLDRDGNVIGANRVVNEGINAGTSVHVVSLWPTALPGEVVTIEVRPRVNILVPDAVIKPQ